MNIIRYKTKEEASQNWKQELLNRLNSELKDDLFWRNYLVIPSSINSLEYSIHLAIFVEPFLQYVLKKEKTVESRFSVNRCAPYKAVNKGDIILIKKSGGPIVGVCLVTQVWFYNLDPTTWEQVKQFSDALCIKDSKFWKQKESKSFATLMCLGEVKKIEPINFEKKDRRGWVVLHSAHDLFSVSKGKEQRTIEL